MENNRALVVDDDDDIAEMLAQLLRRNGYAVQTASSAAEAIETCEASDFDVIISDIAMPRVSGYELARKLRAMPALKNTVMIAITGLSIYDDRNRALSAGFDEQMRKPFGVVNLLTTIERLRKRTARRRKSRR